MDETKKLLEEVLDAKEISELEMFLERPMLVEAVRKVLFHPITTQGVLVQGKPTNPNQNYLLQLVASQHANQGLLNNEALGADLRAKWEATKLIYTAFENMKLFAKVEAKKEVKQNLAR